MSGAVGSTPSFTCSGAPVARDFSSLALSSSSRMISAAPLRRKASCSSTGLKCIDFSFASGLIRSSLFYRELDHAAALDAEAAFEHEAHGLGVNAVLLFQDAVGQRLECIVIEHRHCRLRDDGAGVEVFIHDVHCAAAPFHPVLQRLDRKSVV